MNAAWHPNGRQIFFMAPGPRGTMRMMAVSFTPGSPPRIGKADDLFQGVATCAPRRCYDVDLSPDGQPRFYTFQNVESPPRLPVRYVNLVQNWLEELKAKVPQR